MIHSGDIPDKKVLPTRPKLRISRRTLLPGMLLVIISAVVSGLALSRSADLSSAGLLAAETLLVAHLLTGAGIFLPLTIFLARHWWGRRSKIGGHPNARLGYLALASLLLLLCSGLALLPWTNVSLFRQLHAGAAILLLLDLALHMAWRFRQRIVRRPGLPLGSWSMIFALAGVTALGLMLFLPERPVESGPASQVEIAHDTLTPGALAAAGDCQACHAEITSQWQVSAHAQAAVDPYYLALSSMFIQEQGVEAVRFCAGCHNAVGLMQGEIDENAEVLDGATDHAYEARSLGINLALSQRAAEGVTCVTCHQAPGDPDTSEEARFVQLEKDTPTGILANMALKVAPGEHQASMSTGEAASTIQEAALCSSCHNLTLPSGFRVEPTYDEWLDSPYPEQGVSCQDCHMPQVGGQLVNSGLGTTIASHGGQPGAPSSLPEMATGTELLSQAATLEVDYDIDNGGQPQLTVWVTNSGAGHFLPTGADDLRQLWLAVSVTDAAGQIVWESGQPEANGRLPAGTVMFNKVLGDAGDRPIELHRIWVATQILEDTRLAPLERRPVVFSPSLSGHGPYVVKVRLLYRDVSPDFAEFALNRPVTDLPVYGVASTETSIQYSQALSH